MNYTLFEQKAIDASEKARIMSYTLFEQKVIDAVTKAGDFASAFGAKVVITGSVAVAVQHFITEGNFPQCVPGDVDLYTNADYQNIPYNRSICGYTTKQLSKSRTYVSAETGATIDVTFNKKCDGAVEVTMFDRTFFVESVRNLLADYEDNEPHPDDIDKHTSYAEKLSTLQRLNKILTNRAAAEMQSEPRGKGLFGDDDEDC